MAKRQSAVEPAAASAPKYRAPALEKGLDILELLSRESEPLSAVAISERLKRSPSELFRMIQVLEYRGFIRQASDGGGFVPSEKLFALCMERPPVKTLLETALPVMRNLSRKVGQSCHLTMRSGGDIVVVARIESSEQIGYSVRIGHRRPLLDSTSAVVLFGSMEDEDRARWLAQVPDIDEAKLSAFRARVERARSRGYERARSAFTVGITDIAVPVLRGPWAAAALIVPFVQSRGLQMRLEDVLVNLRSAAAEISQQLLTSDHRI